jgi:hypothetical protein
LRIVGALDSLMQMVSGEGELAIGDSTTIYGRTRVLVQWAIGHLTEEQATVLESVLHPGTSTRTSGSCQRTVLVPRSPFSTAISMVASPKLR